MAIMDNMDDMGSMRARYDELKAHEQDGTISDAGREELNQLRGQFEGQDTDLAA